MNILRTLRNVIEKIQELLYLHLGNALMAYSKVDLGNGDFGLIFGNPGGGKSWSLSCP